MANRHMRDPAACAIAALVVLSLTLVACGKSIGASTDDATITVRVKTVLLNDPQVEGMRIDVDTTLGVVTMSGVVRSEDEEQRAIELARRVPGVRDVRSTLAVAP